MQDNRYLFDNYINIARNFVTEKEYVKALKFYKKHIGLSREEKI